MIELYRVSVTQPALNNFEDVQLVTADCNR